MEKLIEVITEKYSWVPEYKIACDWAELALNQGSDALEVVDYLAGQLFKKAVN